MAGVCVAGLFFTSACVVVVNVFAFVAGVCVVVGFFFLTSPWASVACLSIGLDGWLFGGLILLGPPAMSFSEALCLSVYIVVNTELHAWLCNH